MDGKEKTLYVLRSGEKPGIYLKWLDFFQLIDGEDNVEYKIITYKAELADADEKTPYSMKWAFGMARAYLSGADVDEALAKGGQVPETRDEESSVKASAKQTGADTGEKEKREQDIDWEAIEIGQGVRYMDEEDSDEEDAYDPEADGWNEPYEFETDEEEAAEKKYRELHSKLRLDYDLWCGSPWLDMLVHLAGQKNPWVSTDPTRSNNHYGGRYHAGSLYVMLMYLIFEPYTMIEEILRSPDLEVGPEYDGGDKSTFEDAVFHELRRSPEFKALREHLKKNGMNKLNLRELQRRNIAAVEQLELHRESKSYLALRDFLKSGKHTIVDLYYELVGNPVHQEVLKSVCWSVENPDFAKESQKEEEETPTLARLVEQSIIVRTALKDVVVGQDEAIDKLVEAYFRNEKQTNGKKSNSPRGAFLFAGPPGVGKTYMAELFAKSLNRPYRRFDMSTYASINSMEEVVGISSFYRNSKPGVLTDYVRDNPNAVLLFDEIEKAYADVIRLFLQILDEGLCFDRYHDKNVSFTNCIIIMTTNAGKQLYQNAENENLTAIPDRVVIDALEKDVNEKTGVPFFPPEIVSRMASHTIIMFNQLKADAIRQVIKKDVKSVIRENREKYHCDISKGSDIVAATVQYAVGGGGDARNASKLAGKLVDKELYELFALAEEKLGEGAGERLRQVGWECDFTDCSEEIREFYEGEKNCVIPILKNTDKEYEFKLSNLSNSPCVKVVKDIEAFLEIVRKEKVLFAVIDYVYGLKQEASISIADATTLGSKAFAELQDENPDIPVYLLKNDTKYLYSEREKLALRKRGVRDFIDEDVLTRQLAQVYAEVCCGNAMERMQLRSQVMTYATRRELNETGTAAKIIFYKMKLETAVDAEDKGLLISGELRPDKKWTDIYVSKNIREELEFFIEYLKNTKEYIKTGARAPRGALMFGPPGTGKTSLAKVVASESGVNFLSVSADELLSGGAEKVHELFRVARKYAPAVLFIDEIDAIGVTRKSTGANATLNALLTEMDGFVRIESRPVFVMAATNLQGIDAALARRFDRTFVVDLPDEKGRRWMLERLLAAHGDKFTISEKEIDSIVIRSRGMSPADLENVIETALREGIRSGMVIEDAVLDEIFEQCNMGDRREVSSEKEIEHTAYHEAGHAMIELYYGRSPEYMSVIARGGYGGYVQPERMNEHPTKERFLQEICLSMGGRAAEQEFGYGLTPGASADLASATSLAVRMVCKFGMYEEEIGLAVITEEEYRTDAAAKALVNRILKEQLECARLIIRENKDAVKRLVDAVMHSEQKYLTKKDIMEVYKQ